MLKLAPVLIWTALSNSVISAVFVPLMTNTMNEKTTWSDETKSKHCLLSLVGLGVGEIIGALIYGYVQDNFHNKVTAGVCLLLTSVAVIICLIYVNHYSFSLWFAALMCGMWGI